MKANLAIGFAVGVMACAAAGAFAAVSAQEESPSDAAVSAPAKSQWDGVYSSDQANRGRSVYAQHCTSCHGPDLTGGEMAPELAGGDFAAHWNNQTLDQLFDRIRTTMPLDVPGSLSRQQTADILAYMLRSSTAPAGATDLSTQSDALRTIKYLATDPKAE